MRCAISLVLFAWFPLACASSSSSPSRDAATDSARLTPDAHVAHADASLDGVALPDTGSPLPDAGHPPDATSSAAFDASAFAGDGSPACNTRVGSAPSVVQTQADGGPPGTAMAGTVVDGTYYLTSDVTYDSEAMLAHETESQTLIVHGPLWEVAGTNDGFSANLVFSASSSSFTLEEICPSHFQLSVGTYTATANSIVLYEPETNSGEPPGEPTPVLVSTYTLAGP